MAKNTLNVKMCCILAALLFFAGVVFGQAPNLRFEQITSENGLPQNTIHGIAKDKYGFMWFGTWSGLCRYDGYKFKIYRNHPDNKKSIINNRIHGIITDEHGDLWVSSFEENTVCRYNYEKDDFDRIPTKSLTPTLRTNLNHRNHHNSISFTYKDLQWSMDGATNSLLQTYLPTGKVTQLMPNQLNRWSLNDGYVTDIFLDNDHIFWVGTFSNGINKANLNGKSFQYFYHDSGKYNSLLDNNIRAICEDKKGDLWVGTRDKGISVIEKGSVYRQLRSVPGDVTTLNSDQIKTILCDSKGLIWIGTKKGLDRYDNVTGKIRHFEGDGLRNTSVYKATEDDAGNIWFATWRGIYKYVPATGHMISYDPQITLGNRHAVTIIQDHAKRLWVGTEGGGVSLLKVNPSGGLETVRYFYHDDKKENTVSDNRVYSIFEDSERFVWIGTGNGLDRFDAKKGKFTHFKVSPNGLSDATIAGITEDDNGNVWVSHKRGVSRINKSTFSIRNYSVQDGLQSNEFSDGAVYKSRNTGKLYFGGNSGYNSFYPDSIKDDRTVPPVVLTELQVLSRPVEVGAEINGRVLLNKPLYLNNSISLNHKDKSVAIEFAGLHYSNPSGNKYAYKLEGFDKDWIYTDATRRVATYSNLSSGNYVFKVKAANSDGIWNPTPRELKIEVLPAWWLSKWAYAAYVILLLTAILLFNYYYTRYIRLKSKLGYEAILHEKEIELRQSKIEFFTNISHEIKTPLSLILAPVEQLMAKIGNDSMLAGQLKVMQANGNRLLKLIDQLLDIRRIESGHDIFYKEQGDIVDLIKITLSYFKRSADDKSISLEMTWGSEQIYVPFDHDKIEKVLFNLLSNAIKFTNSGGTIEVTVREASIGNKHSVVIEVKDNGCGIPEEDQERVFKPFQQAHAKSKGGTGLGLAYTRSLVESHGGHISLESRTGAEHYTHFTVSIPIDPFADQIPERKNLPESIQDDLIAGADIITHAGDTSSDKITIDGKVPVLLLVEDNYELRKYLKSCLADQFDILEAENGIEGEAIAHERLPDLIISDVMMPEMDGLELSRRIKSETLTSHIPVILLTARAPIEYQIEGIETGADDYMTKPFNIKLLKVKIRSLLLGRLKLREKYKTRVIIQPSTVNPVSPDERLLKKVTQYVEEKIADPDLDVDDICANVAMSRSQLYRKLKAITGLSVAEVIKGIRLSRAQQLLTDKKFRVGEVAYMVGFTDAEYFRKCFKAEFGVSPSDLSKVSRAESSSK